MAEAAAVITIILFLVFMYFVMRRIDRFLEENDRLLEEERSRMRRESARERYDAARKELRYWAAQAGIRTEEEDTPHKHGNSA